MSRIAIGWRFADHLDKDLVDARIQFLDRLEAGTLRGLTMGAAADPITNPLGISEPEPVKSGETPRSRNY